MDIENFNNDPIYQRYMSKMAALRPDQAASINAVIDNSPYAQDAMQRMFFGARVQADYEQSQRQLALQSRQLESYNKNLIYSRRQNKEALGLAKLGTAISLGSSLGQFAITAKSAKELKGLTDLYKKSNLVSPVLELPTMSTPTPTMGGTK